MKRTILLPEAIIDTHCHGRDLEQKNKTTIEQTLAEARGGNVSITVFMPNTTPPITTQFVQMRVSDIIRKVKIKLGIRQKQYNYFGLTDSNLAECNLALELPEVIGLKSYPKAPNGKIMTTGTIGVSLDETLLEGMRLTREYDKISAYHCDCPIVVKNFGYVIEAEIEYVKRIIQLGKKVDGAKIIICHVSCRQSAELIIKARREGLNIFIEIMPQYLWFDSDGTNWNPCLQSVFYHCYNNLRPKEHRVFLTDLLNSDAPIIIASDTACHTKNEKLTSGLGGIPSNQEMVAVIATLALKKKIPEQRVADLLSFNASSFLNIPVSRRLAEYELEEKVDALLYNNGAVVNPWNGSRLYFARKTKE